MSYPKLKPVVFEVGNQRHVGRVYRSDDPASSYRWYLDFDADTNCAIFGACGLDKWQVARQIFGQGYLVFRHDDVCWPPCDSLKSLRAMIEIIKDACEASDLAAYERINNQRNKT
jgi:hypothetical protein